MTDDSDNIITLKPRRGGSKKNPGKGKAPWNKPARGLPATGMGWGGAPKGKGQPPGNNDGFKAYRALPLEDKRNYMLEREAQAQEALDVMVTVMRGSEHEALRLAAAEKVRNQIMGTPIQRTIVDKQTIHRDVIDPADLTLEERDALRSTLEKAAQKRSVGGEE